MYTFLRGVFCTVFLAFTISISTAQEIESYQWEERTTLTDLSDAENEFGLYYVKVAVHYEFTYDAKDNSLVCYATNHNIIRTNNDEAVNQSNRVYIPMENTIELVDVKARAITPGNKVINFDEVNLKELESDEKGFKILAVEGAEVGGEIEYFYTRKVYPQNFISRSFQFKYPIKDYDFSLKCPDNLEYDFKIYNWQGSVEQTDTTDQYNYYTYKAQDIPAIFEEEFSSFENDRARIELKLAYNTHNNNSRLFTWGDAGKRIYDNTYTLSKGETKAIEKLIKDMDLDGDPMDAFLKAEAYIKNNYFLEKQAGDAGEQIDLIVKNKYATERGFVKMFAAILQKLNIEHEIVLTSNRFEKMFDPDFDSWNYLSEYLIYINKTNQFFSPHNMAFRLGTVPFGFYGTEGLFVRQEQVQDFIHPVAHISYIPETPYQDNMDNMNIEVNFNDEMDKASIQVTRAFKGYSAYYYKTGYLHLEAEERKEMLEEIVKYLALDAEIENVEVAEANTGVKEWDKPFVVKSNYSTSSYIELAGDIILFKAGEVIGPQSELYQENERKLDVVNTFNRGYLRKITVKIPDGYSIQNPEDLVMKEQVFDDKNKLIYNFVSNYKLNGQILEISINEFYDQLTYPVEKFEAFRKVINSAADFNKIVLVLSK